ncbi:MAG: carboxylating nicotinate-nucleotide diphosphorylase [Dehalococcoidales bacterium]
MDNLADEQVNEIIDLALAEDTGGGDITSRILVSPELVSRASIVAKEAGVLAGADTARRVFLRVAPSLDVELLIADGRRLVPGDVVATITGGVAAILKAERVALNFLGRLSGVASATAAFVDRVKGLPVAITDTRKTSPGLRYLDKYAVRVGGGQNHRFSLGDGILVKDNHIAALRARGLALKDIVARAKKGASEGSRVEVEVSTVAEAVEAARAGADVVMLDNMGVKEIRQAVSAIPEGVRTEASGGIGPDNVRAVALAGVDFISVGAITHSAKALDFSLRLE